MEDIMKDINKLDMVALSYLTVASLANHFFIAAGVPEEIANESLGLSIFVITLAWLLCNNFIQSTLTAILVHTATILPFWCTTTENLLKVLKINFISSYGISFTSLLIFFEFALVALALWSKKTKTIKALDIS